MIVKRDKVTTTYKYDEDGENVIWQEVINESEIPDEVFADDDDGIREVFVHGEEFDDDDSAGSLLRVASMLSIIASCICIYKLLKK